MKPAELRGYLRGVVAGVIARTALLRPSERMAALYELLPDPRDLLQRKLLWEELDRLGVIDRPEPPPPARQEGLFG